MKKKPVQKDSSILEEQVSNTDLHNKMQTKEDVYELPDEAIELLKELPDEKRNIILKAIVSVEKSSSFAGPLPPPSLFNGYEKTLPGAADRILKMAEKEQENRHQNNKDMLQQFKGERKRGQYMGCILVVVLAICGLLLGYFGHDWLSGIIFTGALISVPIIFVLNREPQKKQDE